LTGSATTRSSIRRTAKRAFRRLGVLDAAENVFSETYGDPIGGARNFDRPGGGRRWAGDRVRSWKRL